MKLNPYLLRSTIVAALGGLLFGFDTAVIAGTTHALTELYALSPTALGITVSSALFGSIIGSILAGIPGTSMAVGTACALWPSSTSSRRWAAPLRGVGRLWSASASSGASPLAAPRFLVRCILRRSPR